MLWCRQAFEKEFEEHDLKLFSLQKDLFEFIDVQKSTDNRKWFPFSIEFPSEEQVSEILSTRSFGKQNTDQKRGLEKQYFSVLYGERRFSQQSRLFLAATEVSIKRVLERIPSEQLHLYEIIRENTPCHLFFDVERESDVEALRTVDDLDTGLSITVVRFPGKEGSTVEYTTEAYRELAKETPIDPLQCCSLLCPLRADNRRTAEFMEKELTLFLEKFSNRTIVMEEFIVLDSVSIHSSLKTSKFSQHYVVKLKNHAFASTKDAGVFVAEFIHHLRRSAVSDSAVHQSLFYHSKETIRDDLAVYKKNCVIDTAVYSRNRAMRTVGSCKLSKDTVLNVSAWKKNGKLTSFCGPLFNYFFSTLISVWEMNNKSVITLEAEDRVLSVPPSLKKRSFRSLSNSSALVEFDSEVSQEISRSFSQTAGKPCTLLHPKVTDGRFVTFQVSGTRFCQNIMREHKSNNVYIVVDTFRNVWYQKCFDADCASFRAEPKPLLTHLEL